MTEYEQQKAAALKLLLGSYGIHIELVLRYAVEFGVEEAVAWASRMAGKGYGAYLKDYERRRAQR